LPENEPPQWAKIAGSVALILFVFGIIVPSLIFVGRALWRAALG
jgi:hypothetical protein